MADLPEDCDAVVGATKNKTQPSGPADATAVNVVDGTNDTKWSDPETFYNAHIHPRRPCHMIGQSAQILNNSNVWDSFLSIMLQLIQKSEDELPEMEVNVRSNLKKGTNAASSSECSFSPLHGSKIVRMSLKDLYQTMIVEQSEQYYLTTPTLSTDEEGRPWVMTALTREIFAMDPDFLPLRPQLLGHLIPMNIANIWLGASSSSTSSGLHHDYHDNLYCLIRGTKIIRLAPPTAIHDLTMVGTLHTMHPNGRIVYREQLPLQDDDEDLCLIRPDGALVAVEQIVQLEMRKEAIEAELLNDTSTPGARHQQLEEELGAIEEQLLDIEMNQRNEEEEDDEESDDSETGVFFGTLPDQKERTDPPPTKRRKPTFVHDAKKVGSIDGAAPSTAVPPNFVQQWDPQRVSLTTITLHAGDALYIPAGWFHEVESMGGSQEEQGLHMAVNYWYHPPDAVTGSTHFQQPYVSQFWQRDWDARML